MAEINPLVVTGDDRIIAVDAKLNIDDDALFRHREVKGLSICAGSGEDA